MGTEGGEGTFLSIFLYRGESSATSGPALKQKPDASRSLSFFVSLVSFPPIPQLLHSRTLTTASTAHLSRLSKIDDRILAEQQSHQAYLQEEQAFLARQQHRIDNPSAYKKPKKPKQQQSHHGLSSFPMGHYKNDGSGRKGKGGGGDAIDELEGLVDGGGFESGSERSGKRRRVEGGEEGGIGELEDELLGESSRKGGKGVGKVRVSFVPVWTRRARERKTGSLTCLDRIRCLRVIRATGNDPRNLFLRLRSWR